MSKPRLAARAATAGLAWSLVALTPGVAAAAPGSAYGQWNPGSHPTSLTVPAAGFPAATVSSNSTSLSAPSGASTFLNQHTPFGAVYGSSVGEEYLLARTAAGNTLSTTTITFAAPTPTGWGFALGDIDADAVHVAAQGVGGTALTSSQLGWQGAFNACTAQTPRPSSCAGHESDVPTWTSSDTTLSGNGQDTNGAAGWLRPTVPVSRLTLQFSAKSGQPVYQLWVATQTVSISGHVQVNCPNRPPWPPTLTLLQQNGKPVVDGSGHPVTASVAPNGSYSFADVTPGWYQVQLNVPPGFQTSQSVLPADTARGDDATGVNFWLQCAPSPPPSHSHSPCPCESHSPTPSASPHPGSSMSTSMSPRPNSSSTTKLPLRNLASSGSVNLPLICAVGALMLAAGALTLSRARLRPRSTTRRGTTGRHK
jgi:hypothetical protein